MHDFMDKDLGKAIPYGVYDVAANAGWVNAGTDHDTAAFAVESIRRWWKVMGQAAADGCCNGAHARDERQFPTSSSGDLGMHISSDLPLRYRVAPTSSLMRSLPKNHAEYVPN